MSTHPPALFPPPKNANRLPWPGVIALAIGSALIGACGGFALGAITPAPDTTAAPGASTSMPATVVSAEPVPAAPTSPAAPVGPASTFGDGTWEINKDIRPGKYRTTVPDSSSNCYWERMRDFSGGINSIINNDNSGPGQPVVVVIGKSDAAFQSEGCGTWKRVD